MSTLKSPGALINSVAHAKVVASRLGLLLEKEGVSLPRCKLLELVAQLAGARRYSEFRQQFSSATSLRNLPSASEMVLPSLAHVFQKHCTGELTIDRVQVLRCGFEVKHEFHADIVNLVPEGVAAAVKLGTDQRLTREEQSWFSGERFSTLVVELDECLLDGEESSRGWTALGLAQSRCLGDSLWETDISNLVRVDTLEPWSFETACTALPKRMHRQQAREGRRFILPPQFSNYMLITVNVESRLMRLLAGAAATIPLRMCVFSPCGSSTYWGWARSRHDSRKLRAAALQAWSDGGYGLIQVYSHPTHPLAWLSYQVSRLSAAGDLHDHSNRKSYHGEEGLQQLWRDAWCDMQR